MTTNGRTEPDVSELHPSHQQQNAPEPLAAFVTCFNICYPDWKIDGDETQLIEPSHVDYDNGLRSYIGRCGPRSDGRAYFRIKRKWWDNHTPEDRIALVIHELAHIMETNHDPVFWEQVIENYRALAHERTPVETVFETDIDWLEVAKWLVEDPTNTTVNNRSETAYERRLKLADELGVGRDYVDSFDGMDYGLLGYCADYDYDRSDVNQIYLGRVEYDPLPVEDVLDWWYSRPRTGVGMHGTDKFWIDPIIVQPLPDDHPLSGTRRQKYEVVDGLERLSFVHHKRDSNRVVGNGRIRVVITDNDDG